ncbi:MAG: DNA polymerase III subunit beta [Candidatus Moranbacteria bacterium]|nr:DNA polymerase III subunit beta [Candidatus Moranbacteria bacterium]
MKLICTQDNFKKAITNSERIVSRQNTLPILNNILLEASKGYLKITATNLEIGIEIKIGAKIEKEGRITVPAKLLGNFSSNLTEGENMDIEATDQNLKIKNGSTKAMIKGFSAEDFPLIPQKNTEKALGIAITQLKDIFSKILISVAHNEARQELTGVNVTFGEKELLFASTDGFRLSEYVLKLNEGSVNRERYSELMEKTKNIIIPTNTLLELNRIISNNFEDGEVGIFIEEGQIFFEVREIKLVSRLINGKYPEYKHIMPQNYKTTITGERKVLQNALKIAGVFVNNKSNEVVLKIDAGENKIIIDTKSAEVGENSTEINFKAQGESQEIVFNLKYLLEGINVVTTNSLALSANSDSSPVAIRELDTKTGEPLNNFTYIIMPIKN